MEKVRIGNDIQVKYTVLRDGLPESFAGATNIVVEVRNEAYGKVIPSTFSIVDNVVNVVLDAKDCVLCGKHRVTLSYNRGNDITIDALAFELVQFTSQTGGTEIVGVEIVTVNISGDIGIAIPDNNKIDLDGLNSNIDKLHFKPDTLVQLAEVGDVRYSPENRTLEVKVSDTVSIQLGQEMQTRVKNDAGVQINNGQLVYIDSAAGANPLAKIASITNADIAQRTFGMATENIPANGFGAITTEGLVRDINTAAFPEGAMLWLGTNGSVTNIEPTAPTSKISIGMVLRSNVANGVIYVKIRAIARNQKLSDVYAPTLTTGDVLRWNSTTLRFEVYNLSNKADLVAGKIPASQLPAYVDDILEYANLAAFPLVGETGKLYVTLDTNITYRWSGSAYTEVSKSLAIGITSTTAFRGDWGKIAYDHSQLTNSNPHGTTAAQIANTPAGTIAATTVQAAINELDADRAQLETDLSIKNAEQDVSIKSIEQILSQSNLNQTAQVSSTGREIISLPKTASNGGMDVKLEGLTAQNLVVNGDFRNGTTGWTNYPSSTSLTIENKALKVVATTDGYAQVYKYIPTIIGNKYYTRLKYVAGNVVPGLVPINGIYTATLTGMQIKISGGALAGDYYYAKSVISIDLTATFGAGNEPDLATCDAMFSSYFDGTKSFIPTGRVRSVGKNIWNTTLESGSIGADGTLFVNASFTRPKDYISVIPNTNYKISKSDLQPFSAYINYYDINRKGISQSVSSINQFTTPSNCYFIKFSRSNTETLVDLQLEKGSVATPYEPYKETELYLTTPELRSNGIVKDEIRKGYNGYELVKRVGVATLGSEKVIYGTFDSISNWTVPSGRASISGGTLNIDVTAWGADVRQTMSFVKDKYYFVEFDVTVLTRAGSIFVYSNAGFSVNVSAVGHYYLIFKASTTGLDALKINSSSIACSIDNISVKEVTESEEIASTSTFTKIGSNVHYTLATPVITPISYGGVLNSAESGTVLHEPVVADAGIYGINLTVLNTTYPISSLEEIMVHTNVDTYLDVSKAVIASDGLSFTHPDLRAGDLVLFTYFLNKEKVNGLITATYYDGRYVIADTANGKFYKWGVKATNGVAIIQLTEV